MENWESILNSLNMIKTNSRDFSKDAILSMMKYVRIYVYDKNRHLEEQTRQLPCVHEAVRPFVESIDKRLVLLDNVLGGRDWNVEEHEMVQMVKRGPISLSSEQLKQTPEEEDSSAAVHPGKLKTPSGDQMSLQSRSNETLAYIVLITFFLIGAITVGCVAFSIASKNEAKGSTADDGFYTRIQGSMMAILANLIAIVPLLNENTKQRSAAYMFVWVFLGIGIVCAAISIGIYPHFNTRWSSLVSFFGSIASAISILVMTQLTTKDNAYRKSKEEREEASTIA